jgi:hypothetical protein
MFGRRGVNSIIWEIYSYYVETLFLNLTTDCHGTQHPGLIATPGND